MVGHRFTHCQWCVHPGQLRYYGSTGKYRFNLVATNGQIIATSEAYESKANALKGTSR
jgi:Domain of unknown function (DUF1508)